MKNLIKLEQEKILSRTRCVMSGNNCKKCKKKNCDIRKQLLTCIEQRVLAQTELKKALQLDISISEGRK